MRLHVPFIANKEKDCGPVSLQMVLAYFGSQRDLADVQERIEPDTSGNTWTVGIAKAAATLGFPVEFYTTKLGFNPESFQHAFVQQHADPPQQVEAKLARMVREARANGAHLEERHLALGEILERVSENCIPIILLDWGVVQRRSGYHGHIAPIVGYDEEYVYIHDSGPHDPTPFFKVPLRVFEQARMASGTDEDIVFVRRPTLP